MSGPLGKPHSLSFLCRHCSLGDGRHRRDTISPSARSTSHAHKERIHPPRTCIALHEIWRRQAAVPRPPLPLRSATRAQTTCPPRPARAKPFALGVSLPPSSAASLARPTGATQTPPFLTHPAFADSSSRVISDRTLLPQLLEQVRKLARRRERNDPPPAAHYPPGGAGHRNTVHVAVESAEAHCLAFLSRLYRPP